MTARKLRSSRSDAAPAAGRGNRAQAPPTAPARAAVITAHTLLFISGALALVYELLWLRRFTSLFGATAPAASATLVAIFLGFALGSAIIGARTVRWTRPWFVYGVLEIGIGVSALLVAPMLGLYSRFYGTLYLHFAAQPIVFIVVKTGLAIAALLLPGILMGGTVPLLGQALTVRGRPAGALGSSLYAANTAGAVAGALVVPFWLLPELGAQGGYWLAVIGSLVVGGAALAFSRNQPTAASAPAENDSETIAPSPFALGWRRLIALAFLSGLLTIMLEILWTRMLAQVHENSIYSFAIVTAVFLFGLAGGAVLARILARRAPITELLAIAWVVGGLFVLISPRLFYYLSNGLDYLTGEAHSIGLQTLWLAIITMLLPLLAAGMVLPLLINLAGSEREGEFGARLGRLLAANTAGAIIGPLLATYLLLPKLGLWWSIALAATVMVIGGELLLGDFAARGRVLTRRVAAVGLFALLAVACNPTGLARVRMKADEDGTPRLVNLREGSHGIVAVLENEHDRWMLLDNFYTLGGTGSALEERQQAEIPLLLHPAPRRVAFLGLGTAITASGALLPGVEKITALELVPEVVTTARDHFGEANLNFLRDPRVEVVTEDARIYLRNQPAQYDVVVGDLVVPWRQGESSLFTREHFQAARGALAPDGMFCQWLPMFQLTEEQFQIIAATFLDVFPNTTVWRGDFFADMPAVALIGHTSAKPIDSNDVDKRVMTGKDCCAQQRGPVLSHPAGLWMYLVGALDGQSARFQQARRNSEDQPWIELLSPRTNSAAGGRAKNFSGRPLQQFFNEVRGTPLTNSALADLGTLPLYWRDGGTALWEASLLLSEGREQEGEQRALEGLEMMPAELQATITGDGGLHDSRAPH